GVEKLPLLILDFEHERIGVLRTVAFDAAQDERQRIALVIVSGNEVGRPGIPERVHHGVHLPESLHAFYAPHVVQHSTGLAPGSVVPWAGGFFEPDALT